MLVWRYIALSRVRLLSGLHLANFNFDPKCVIVSRRCLEEINPLIVISIMRCHDVEPLRNFEKIYKLKRELSIDESMIGFKGRLSFLQYLPKKTTKRGMKTFVLAESSTGYTLKWRFYTAGNLIEI